MANKALKEWREVSPHTGNADWVWFGQRRTADGKPKQIGDLNKSFQNYLRAIEMDGREEGLLYSRDGERRSLYSLRHTYATLRLEKGDVSIYDLSLNMGCQIKQIETHYSHVVSKQRRKQITRTNIKKKTANTDLDMASLGSQMSEVINQYKAGQITEEAFLAIVNSADTESS